MLGLIGSGKALVFRDGTLMSGTRKKRSSGDLTRFYDASGVEIELNRGRILIQVVAIGTGVRYKLAS